MVDAELLKILCCPESHQELKFAEPSLISQLNKRIGEGSLKNRANQPIVEKIDSGLIRADGKFLYPIRRNIPVLLVDEAVPIY